jgi:transcriptional regulator with PAS, ATPase and Fis domain
MVCKQIPAYAVERLGRQKGDMREVKHLIDGTIYSVVTNDDQVIKDHQDFVIERHNKQGKIEQREIKPNNTRKEAEKRHAPPLNPVEQRVYMKPLLVGKRYHKFIAAKMWGCTIDQAQRILYWLERAGLIEYRRYYVASGYVVVSK